MIDPVTRPVADIERIEARLGLRIGALLNERAQHAPHDISERLRTAREQALARARVVRAATSPSTVTVAGGQAAVLGRQPGWLFRIASVVPLLVLVAGMVLIDQWHDRVQIEAAAEVDAALLTDDLPPDAYSDAGFVEFLKENAQ
jgi:hypothetical protein